LPDIVTVGKLMGNGHLGNRGTIAPEVIEAFGKRIRYISTPLAATPRPAPWPMRL
jgi:hypothetical protein